MKAAVLYGPRMLAVEERPTPRPPRGWALVETRLVGICGTDKAFYKGTYPLLKKPLVPGHEAVGVVVEGPEDLMGEQVVTEINLVLDWSHPACRAGPYTHCPPETRRVLGITMDGAMAEYFLSKPEALHPATGIPPEKAVYAEPLAAVLRAYSLAPIHPGDTVAVLGTGPIALLAAQVARLQGASRIIVVARPDSPKRSLFEKRGFETMTLEEALREAQRQSPHKGFDVVVEATGDPQALRHTVELAKPMATIHLKSTHGLPAPLPQTTLVVNEQRIIGSRCGTAREFREALRLLREGLVEAPITATYTIDEAREAIEASLQRNQLKVAVKP